MMKSVNYLALLILKRARHKIIFKMKKLKIQQFGRLSEAYLTQKMQRHEVLSAQVIDNMS